MDNLIILNEKVIAPKSLDPSHIIDEDKLKEYFFTEDYNNLKLLKKVSNLKLSTKIPTLLYPGCGADIFFPLIYLTELFHDIKEANFIFVDENDYFGIIKTILDEVGVGFTEERNKIDFYWGGMLIHLAFVNKDIKSTLPELPTYHIYFERAFRIMRDRIKDYEQNIFDKLVSGGVIISDSGFENIPLQKIDAPLELSSYQEMIIGIKN